MTNSASSYVAICTESPGSGFKAREALDMLLATAAFGQPISVLFCGDGVYQLLPKLQDATGNDKSLAASLEALPLYDVENIYVDQQSLDERNLDADQLSGLAQVITVEASKKLIGESDKVLSL